MSTELAIHQQAVKTYRESLTKTKRSPTWKRFAVNPINNNATQSRHMDAQQTPIKET